MIRVVCQHNRSLQVKGKSRECGWSPNLRKLLGSRVTACKYILCRRHIQSTGVHCLDSFHDRLNMRLWPRFKMCVVRRSLPGAFSFTEHTCIPRNLQLCGLLNRSSCIVFCLTGFELAVNIAGSLRRHGLPLHVYTCC